MKNITFMMPKIDLELVCDLFLSYGVFSTTITNVGKEKSYNEMWIDEPGESKWEVWKNPSIIILASLETSGELLAIKVMQHFNLSSPPNFIEKKVKKIDWIIESQKNNVPNKISEKLWVLPVGKIPIDNNVANIFLNPGYAFGPGTHSTTKLCLEWLSENIIGGESIIDYGCGSGILSIAALKLGCSSSIAVDIDSEALNVTKQNSLINKLSISTYLPENLPKIKCDIIIANILANPLIELFPKFQSLLKPGGYLVISGILESQIKNVKTHYNNYFSIKNCKIKEEWALISGSKLN
ncbi:50S ribosomal protein L11 methyltransferase [Candidatus Marinimicrobia bacterium]|nr:50S ribosomal protein L11 methyltransferase [Candidatus Neomarinimicrobiota bacterium]